MRFPHQPTNGSTYKGGLYQAAHDTHTYIDTEQNRAMQMRMMMDDDDDDDADEGRADVARREEGRGGGLVWMRQLTRKQGRRRFEKIHSRIENRAREGKSKGRRCYRITKQAAIRF